ncbi:MAG: bacillithiol system redox-active protein YtxJ [Eudoraea sp.]|uniref:bacillithiol system redox-active protein YtxJ n=1 Tax=Eudoraea sp. TaxID=1979955 RepID=UPI003C78E351
MGFLNGLFNDKGRDKKTTENKTDWIDLSSQDQLKEIVENSYDRMQIIFKHSTSCGISSMVLRSFKASFNLEPDKAQLYYLDLRRYRDISNEIANKFQVAHESPQVLVIRNGDVVEHDSHSDINRLQFNQFI